MHGIQWTISASELLTHTQDSLKLELRNISVSVADFRLQTLKTLSDMKIVLVPTPLTEKKCIKCTERGLRRHAG